MIKTQAPATEDAIRFFYDNAGYSHDPKTETQDDGHSRSAARYASAEQFAKERGWVVSWEWDDEPYQMGDAETDYPTEVLGCVLKDSHGQVLSSCWGIADPSTSYRRVMEAELAGEAIADAPHRFQRTISTLADDLQTALTHVVTGYDGAEITTSTVEPIRKSSCALAELAAMLLDRCDGADGTKRKTSFEYKVRKALG